MDHLRRIFQEKSPLELAFAAICGNVAPMRPISACVGLVVMIGCLLLVIAPDDLPETSARPFPLSLPTVVVDPGHGGNDDGAKCHGLAEKTLTLDIGLRVDRALRKLGYRTILTRSDDRYVSLAERVAVANAVEGDAVFVSIHFNQASGKDTEGIETFYARTKTPPPTDWTWVGLFSRSGALDTGETLAASVQLAATDSTGARNRGIRARDLYVTRNTRIPAILIEGGFITNVMEAHLLKEDGYADRLAQAIADGVDAWWQEKPRGHPSPLANTR